jgi:hypothetical protein
MSLVLARLRGSLDSCRAAAGLCLPVFAGTQTALTVNLGGGVGWTSSSQGQR